MVKILLNPLLLKMDGLCPARGNEIAKTFLLTEYTVNNIQFCGHHFNIYCISVIT